MFQRARQQRVSAAWLESAAGLKVCITDHGAAIRSIRVPVAGGHCDVVLGYEDLQDYASDPFYMGATLGRYANRIAGGRFRLDGREYELDVNEKDRGHCLHGGAGGLSSKRWSLVIGDDGSSVECRYSSPDGDQGFPGQLAVSVMYQLLGDYSLGMEFTASSDRDTVLSLANHAYFKLDGDADTIDRHVLQLNAPHYTPADATLIPHGKVTPVHGTAFDYMTPVYLRDALTGIRRVLDTNFVINGKAGELREAANLYAPESGIRLVVHTTQPGLQVYTADHLGAPFRSRQGICLEAQNFPDAPNQPGFPSARLAPGQVYRQRTIYEFVPPLP